MRYTFTLLIPFLFHPLTLCAQTPAQKALANEPEVRRLLGITDDLKKQQQLPNNDINKPSLAGMALNGFSGIKEQQVLLDSLEDRLDQEVRACHFCASKQEELSELIRERVTFKEFVAHISSQVGGGAPQFLLDATSATTRWQDRQIPLGEAARYLRDHCPRVRGTHDEYCDAADGDFQLAGAHENAWAKCFNEHNWVEKPSERIAYESCLNANDPFTKLCNQGRKASPPEQSCPGFAVHFADVDKLHFYNDRWTTDPNRLPATAVIVPNQPAHVTLLEPVIVPPSCTGALADKPGQNCLPGTRNAGFGSTVRGRLENSLEGEYAPSLNPSTTGIASLKPSITDGLSGRVILIPAGTEVPVGVRFSAQGGDRANGGILWLQIVTNNLNIPPDVKGGQLISQDIPRQLPWPAGGTVLFPANSSFSFATQCGCPYAMSVAEFRKRAATNASSAAKAANPTYTSRPILMGSRIQTVLLDPIDVPGIQAGKRFHAQLNVDMELPRGTTRTDAIKLPRGTDVYLKVTDQNAGAQAGGHNAQLAVDYVVFNGQQISLHTPAWPHTFAPQFLSTRNPRRPPTADIIWPAGDTKWFDIMDQVEVSPEGMKPEQVAKGGPSPDTANQNTQSNGTQAGTQPPGLPALPQTQRLIVPQGTVIAVRMVDSVDSSRDKVGKEFTAKVDTPIMVAGEVVIPQGTEAHLRMLATGNTSAQPSLQLQLFTLTVNGKVINVAATIYSQAGVPGQKPTTQTSGGSTPLRGVLGALGRGNEGRAIGAVIGGSRPTNTSGVQSAPQTVPAETKIEFILRAPFTVMQ